jgi:hypothetical protein
VWASGRCAKRYGVVSWCYRLIGLLAQCSADSIRARLSDIFPASSFFSKNLLFYRLIPAFDVRFGSVVNVVPN